MPPYKTLYATFISDTRIIGFRWVGGIPIGEACIVEEYLTEEHFTISSRAFTLVDDASGDRVLRMTDVRDGEERFGTFVQPRILPGLRQLGIPGQPDMITQAAHEVTVTRLQLAPPLRVIHRWP